MHYLDPHVIGKNNNIRVERTINFDTLDPCMAIAHCIINEDERKEFIDTIVLQEYLFPSRTLITWESEREVTTISDDNEDWEVCS